MHGVVGDSRHAKTALFLIEVGGNDRFSCYRRLPNLFTIAIRYSARVFNRKCKLAREQHGIERGSAHQQASEFLCPRSCATATNNSKAQREDSNRM